MTRPAGLISQTPSLSWRILLYLNEVGRKQQAHISRELKIDPDLTSKLLSSLRARGLIDAKKDKMPGFFWYWPSAAGKERIAAMRGVMGGNAGSGLSGVDTVSIPGKLRFLDQLSNTIFKDHSALAGIIADYRAALLEQSKQESEALV